MVANSEPLVVMLCDVFKTTPDRLTGTLQHCGFFGGLAAHALAVFAVAKSIKAKSIKESRQEKTAKP
jgi:23S rRNA maturation-related 3'-5' exoribonuclease YhaM